MSGALPIFTPYATKSCTGALPLILLQRYKDIRKDFRMERKLDVCRAARK
jgi:hypothetical protein